MGDEVLHARVEHIHEQVVKMGQKLDVMTDIMLAMARTEERIVSIVEHNQRQDTAIEENKREIRTVRALIDGPDGIHVRLNTVVTRVGSLVAIGVFVINIYFKTFGK